MSHARTWLITGASQGLGRFLAEAALEAGDRVALAVRKPTSVDDLVAKHPETAVAVRLDVTNHCEISSALVQAEGRLGPIDILMSNAGYVLVGAVEEATADQYRALFETNFFGALEVIRAVVPRMRARNAGHILAMSAMGGLVSSGGLAYYCATKAALESICEGLAQELAPLGIKVTIVEPGNFRTGVLGARTEAPVIAAYEATAGALRRRFASSGGTQMGDPKRAAEAIVALTRDPSPPLRLPLGRDAVERISAKLAQVAQEIARSKDVAIATAFPQ
jgi:NAD(P)-dependent dehydrogenase (short-subunit alcohol dehydrogenase family)